METSLKCIGVAAFIAGPIVVAESCEPSKPHCLIQCEK